MQRSVMPPERKAGGGASGRVILDTGAEMRPDEYRDLIIYAVRKLLSGIPDSERSRRRTLCEDILKRNTPSGYESELHEALSRLFKDGRDIVGGLEGLGFEYVRSSKHHVLRWGDQTLTVSETPSDKRASDNIVSAIKRQVFVGDSGQGGRRVKKK